MEFLKLALIITPILLAALCFYAMIRNYSPLGDRCEHGHIVGASGLPECSECKRVEEV